VLVLAFSLRGMDDGKGADEGLDRMEMSMRHVMRCEDDG